MLLSSSRQPIRVFGGAAVREPRRVLRFQVEHQEQDLWCWAAVATSVAAYYDPTSHWTQCGVAETRDDCANCCADKPGCNKPGRLEVALATVKHLDDGTAMPQPGALTFAALRDELDTDEVVGVRIGWPGGTGHFVVVHGYDEISAMVEVEDPWYGHQHITYDALVAAYPGDGHWTHTYLTRK